MGLTHDEVQPYLADASMDDLEPQYEYSDTGFPVPRPIQYFSLAFRSPNVLRLVNVDQHIASCVQEKVLCCPLFLVFGVSLLRCDC